MKQSKVSISKSERKRDTSGSPSKCDGLMRSLTSLKRTNPDSKNGLAGASGDKIDKNSKIFILFTVNIINYCLCITRKLKKVCRSSKRHLILVSPMKSDLDVQVSKTFSKICTFSTTEKVVISGGGGGDEHVPFVESSVKEGCKNYLLLKLMKFMVKIRQ